MPTDSSRQAQPPVLPYRHPDLPLPVTRAERLAVLSGYILLAGGLLTLPWLMYQPGPGRLPVWIALAATLLGAGVTAFCYITNAIRRM